MVGDGYKIWDRKEKNGMPTLKSSGSSLTLLLSMDLAHRRVKTAFEHEFHSPYFLIHTDTVKSKIGARK